MLVCVGLKTCMIEGNNCKEEEVSKHVKLS